LYFPSFLFPFSFFSPKWHRLVLLPRRERGYFLVGCEKMRESGLRHQYVLLSKTKLFSFIGKQTSFWKLWYIKNIAR
jgi:hypothetical protein